MTEPTARGASPRFRPRVLFLDLDGVLVDSSAVVRRSWSRWAREHGLDPDEVVRTAQGRRQIETIRDLAPAGVDVEAEAEKLGRWEAEDTEGLRIVPGADELVRVARQGTWAIVTSGTVPIARTRLTHVGLPEPEVFVTAEDVERGKPAPEAYERAARLLEVDPGVGLVFEDSPAGVQAARRAGMQVIGVATTHGPESLAAADWVVASPAETRIVAEDDGFSIYEREDGLGH